MNNLSEYLNENYIQFTINEDVYTIDNKTYFLINPDEEGFILNKGFELCVDEEKDVDYYIFELGGRYYYTDANITKVSLNPLKYIGEIKGGKFCFPYVGIHGYYELLNGSRSYDDWCKKAKFIGYNYLGICEKNTLAGTMKFQNACKNHKITSIIGASYDVLVNDNKNTFKFYVKNVKGWKNILKLNEICNVRNKGNIDIDNVFEFSEGLVVVIDPKVVKFDIYKTHFDNFYYQIDGTEFDNPDIDKEYLLNLEKYLQYNFNKALLIQDSYYLDKEDWETKELLNKISGSRSEYSSKNQYFKSVEDLYKDINHFFKKSDFEKILINTIKIFSFKFEIETGKRHLPQYKMTKEESEKFKTNEDFFWHLVDKGLKEKGYTEKKYFDRLQKEIEIIKEGGVIDYFTITQDFVSWARKNNILTGFGRGSAGGCLLSNILNITYIDPLEYNLLFERFLTRGRLKTSLPDIDIDFESCKRQDVKKYIEHKYGEEKVCSIGTYATLKIKALLKDLARIYGVNVATINYINSLIEDNWTYEDLLKNSLIKEPLYDFIQNNAEMISKLPLLVDQPKNKSVHPCAMIITPQDMTCSENFPIRLEGDEIISEYEGEELENIGFLKVDILGSSQLDKVKSILTSIQTREGKLNFDPYNLPEDDDNVFRYFSNGWSGDTFHFKSDGLTNYNKELKPENFKDLVAAISLYRKGVMDSGFHKDYVNRKHGIEEITYLEGTEKFTKNTYGIIIFQETVMRICSHIGDFNEEETDSIRKSLGKKKLDVLQPFRERFVKNGVKKGYNEKKLIDLWVKLENFAGYSFNESHAVGYTKESYRGQWLKVHFPVDYWMTALKKASEKEMPKYISEIYKTGSINVVGVDINHSEKNLVVSDNNIMFALLSIKNVSNSSVDPILKEKEKGDYLSFEDFYKRLSYKGSKVNKTVFERIIICGGFDQTDSLEHPRDRVNLINQYRKISKVKVNKSIDWFEPNSHNHNKNWWWLLLQRQYSGIAFFDWKNIVLNNIDNVDFCEVDKLQQKEYAETRERVSIGGYILDIQTREIKKGEMATILIDSNYDFLYITIFPKEWEQFKPIIERQEKSILICDGEVGYDKWKKQNVLYLDDESSVKILN